MQSNLHLVAPNEQRAMGSRPICIEQGVTDIITFDYWSSKLNQKKDEARELALEAAKRKSDSLLSLFDENPKLINLQENTAVFFPRDLYRTFENILEEEVGSSHAWRDLPSIKAFRPKMTFFDGLKSESDVRPLKIGTETEISVVSTVRLYFESPATKQPVVRPRW